MEDNYIMFHCHTELSILDSCTKAQEYIDLAVKNNQKAISFSEHGKPLNWTEKWKACKDAGIKYIHSVEIYLTESLGHKLVRDNYHTVLIAKNMEGVRELNKLVSLSCNKDHFYYTNRISFEEFLNISDNIISTSACLASPLNKLPSTHPMYMKLANKYTFLEIQAHPCEDQIQYNKRLLELSKKIGKPLIAGTDTHSSNKYKAECRAVLLDAKHKSYGNEEEFDLTYKTYDELVDMFAGQNAIPEEEYMKAIENTNLLYDLTEEIDLDTTIKYPILYGSREKDSEVFEETVERKFREKLETGVIPRSQEEMFREAIEEEMRVFKKLHMDGFMLSMSELICWCKSQGLAIGTARGSVGGSRVAYVTDIIDLNPETWHTVFSRFCNEDREEIGDIDIDCVDTDRPKIFNYIVERFGLDKTARVASFGTMQAKGVIDDVGRHLSMKWEREHQGRNKVENPWSLKQIAKIKEEYNSNPEKTAAKYEELFYYFDGLLDTKISQSVHPAGMVISPITLNDNYGVFDKEGDQCLMLDMDNVHDFTGLAKYDFLILKTVQVIRDTCSYINEAYPKTHEIDWNDENVWDDMMVNPTGIFQFESVFAFDSYKKFHPKNIFEMSVVTACIRPSGTSYRDDLLARKIHKNPSEIIDELLKDNLGYLIYQEDTIKFLQQICGLSGSEADNIRRAIGRKQKERLDAALPSILEGYCSKSPRPREKAEKEAGEFLKVIEDSASYQFGYNHSIAYCLLGYLCGYYRYYHPLEFLTSFLNNAANDDDIKNGSAYAEKIGVKITMPKWGISRGEYSFDRDRKIIAKGLASVKFMSKATSDELYRLSNESKFDYFVDLLRVLSHESSLNSKQLDILIGLDFFSDFGNQRELRMIVDIYKNIFNKGDAIKISKDKVEYSEVKSVIQKYSIGVCSSGKEAKSYTMLDNESALRECELVVKQLNLDDVSDYEKIRASEEAMGYIGFMSGKQEDRSKLYVLNKTPLKRKKDGKQFGYSVITRSIGSGKESRFTIFNRVYASCPIEEGDIIRCTGYTQEGIYYTMTGYRIIEKCT